MAKRSPMRQKQVAARKRKYTPEQAAQYKSCGCDPRPRRSCGDDIDEKLRGGYRTGKDNRCETHPYMVLTVNGTCIFCE